MKSGAPKTSKDPPRKSSAETVASKSWLAHGEKEIPRKSESEAESRGVTAKREKATSRKSSSQHESRGETVKAERDVGRKISSETGPRSEANARPNKDVPRKASGDAGSKSSTTSRAEKDVSRKSSGDFEARDGGTTKAGRDASKKGADHELKGETAPRIEKDVPRKSGVEHEGKSGTSTGRAEKEVLRKSSSEQEGKAGTGTRADKESSRKTSIQHDVNGATSRGEKQAQKKSVGSLSAVSQKDASAVGKKVVETPKTVNEASRSHRSSLEQSSIGLEQDGRKTKRQSPPLVRTTVAEEKAAFNAERVSSPSRKGASKDSQTIGRLRKPGESMRTDRPTTQASRSPARSSQARVSHSPGTLRRLKNDSDHLRTVGTSKYLPSPALFSLVLPEVFKNFSCFPCLSLVCPSSPKRRRDRSPQKIRITGSTRTSHRSRSRSPVRTSGSNSSSRPLKEVASTPNRETGRGETKDAMKLLAGERQDQHSKPDQATKTSSTPQTVEAADSSGTLRRREGKQRSLQAAFRSHEAHRRSKQPFTASYT